MTEIGTLIRTATTQLRASGIESARWDAERLVAHRLNTSRLALYAYPELPVDEEVETELLSFVSRRSRREPLQYLIGRQEFWDFSLLVSPDVLIPRPETECLVEAALSCRGKMSPGRNPVIVDIGTGSGCLVIALGKEMPEARLYATDISQKALSLARENARIQGLSERIRFIPGDLLAPLHNEGLMGHIDYLVCNPPYIPSKAMADLQPEVRDYEPRIALEGGADGLLFYRRLLTQRQRILSPDGWLILEMGFSQSQPVATLARTYGWTVDQVIGDAAGIPRVMILKDSRDRVI